MSNKWSTDSVELQPSLIGLACFHLIVLLDGFFPLILVGITLLVVGTILVFTPTS